MASIEDTKLLSLDKLILSYPTHLHNSSVSLGRLCVRGVEGEERSEGDEEGHQEGEDQVGVE